MTTLEVLDQAPGRELTATELDVLTTHLSSARSKNTNLAYRRAWLAFVRWCRKSGHQAFPTTPAVVALYLSQLNKDGRRTSTLQQAVAAIRAVHDDNGHSFDWFRHHLVRATLASVRRSMVEDGRNTVAKPRAFSQADILAMSLACPESTAQGVQDRALLLLGVNAGLRASEYIALTASDIVFDGHGMDIQLRSSKTDQLGEGETIYVASLAPSQRPYDAVEAMREWLRWRESFPEPQGAIFIAFRRGGNTAHKTAGGHVHGLTRDAITSSVVRCWKRAGIEGLVPSSHSMRHTFVSQAFSKGIDATRIAKTSRHKSMRTLMGYDQTSRKNNPVSPALWA